MGLYIYLFSSKGFCIVRIAEVNGFIFPCKQPFVSFELQKSKWVYFSLAKTVFFIGRNTRVNGFIFPLQTAFCMVRIVRINGFIFPLYRGFCIVLIVRLLYLFLVYISSVNSFMYSSNYKRHFYCLFMLYIFKSRWCRSIAMTK